MNEINPLEVLGIDAYVLEGLSSEQARLLVGERKRILSLIFHPDLSSDKELHKKLVEINAAASALQIPTIFDESLRSFLRREARRRKGASVEPLSEKVEHLTETLLRLIQARGGIFPQPPERCEENTSRTRYALPGSIGFRPHACLISDVMPQIIGRHMPEENRANIMPARYELKSVKNGKSTVQRLKSAGPYTNQELTREQKDGWNFRQGNQVHLWVGSSEPVPLEETVVGTVDQAGVDRRLHAVACEEFAKKRTTLTSRQETNLFASHKWYRQLLRYPTSQLDLREAAEGYPFEKIESFLPFFEPYLVPGALILSAITQRSEHPLYRVMGTLDGYRVLD